MSMAGLFIVQNSSIRTHHLFTCMDTISFYFRLPYVSYAFNSKIQWHSCCWVSLFKTKCSWVVLCHILLKMWLVEGHRNNDNRLFQMWHVSRMCAHKFQNWVSFFLFLLLKKNSYYLRTQHSYSEMPLRLSHFHCVILRLPSHRIASHRITSYCHRRNDCSECPNQTNFHQIIISKRCHRRYGVSVIVNFQSMIVLHYFEYEKHPTDWDGETAIFRIFCRLGLIFHEPLIRKSTLKMCWDKLIEF